MGKTPDYQLKAGKKYDEKNTVFVGLKLNLTTDKDIIDRLNAEPNKQGFIKQCIREYINK